MRKSERQKKAEGEDLGGSQMRRRFEEVEQAAREAKQAAASASRRGGAPQPDARVSGSKVANPGSASDAGFKVYTEKAGGRAGGRGKRV